VPFTGSCPFDRERALVEIGSFGLARARALLGLAARGAESAPSRTSRGRPDRRSPPVHHAPSRRRTARGRSRPAMEGLVNSSVASFASRTSSGRAPEQTSMRRRARGLATGSVQADLLGRIQQFLAWIARDPPAPRKDRRRPVLPQVNLRPASRVRCHSSVRSWFSTLRTASTRLEPFSSSS